MGQLRNYPPVKYFAAITCSSERIPQQIIVSLQTLLSGIDFQSEVYDFNHFTHYYQAEMGQNLNKRIVSFDLLKPAEMLPDIKIATNELESQYQQPSGREVNIDPGYICAAKVVLATTKDYDHRLYLNRGIFGDVHLRFRNGQFRTNDWTYPDYQQTGILSFFRQLRQTYLEQLKNWRDD